MTCTSVFFPTEELRTRPKRRTAKDARKATCFRTASPIPFRLNQWALTPRYVLIMADWLILVIFIMFVILFFWFIKVYFIVRSTNWLVVKATIHNIYAATGGDTDVMALTVQFEYNDTLFCQEVLDSGSINLRDKSIIGDSVILLVNPAAPEQCVVRDDGVGFFDSSALFLARIISKFMFRDNGLNARL